ncbi:hypothetical protein H8356DRAFT_1433254 [Neocallimastix lanati (nom. inval.)]|nr:hypothetical protein H8356DRAFT_1433254 [Neocallimastix sp. JGI-2020a]
MIYKDLRRIDTVSVRYYYGGFYPFLLNNNDKYQLLCDNVECTVLWAIIMTLEYPITIIQADSTPIIIEKGFPIYIIYLITLIFIVH